MVYHLLVVDEALDVAQTSTAVLYGPREADPALPGELPGELLAHPTFIEPGIIQVLVPRQLFFQEIPYVPPELLLLGGEAITHAGTILRS